MGIEDFLRKGPVYLDTNIFIYALEDFPEYAAPIKKTFELIDQATAKAFTSEFTLAEVLVKPFIVKNESLTSLYQDLIQDSPISISTTCNSSNTYSCCSHQSAKHFSYFPSRCYPSGNCKYYSMPFFLNK
jgi:hypothetical protein